LNNRLGPESGVAKKSMFGGRAWLLNGNLLCAAREDRMLLRLGKGKDGWAIDHPGVVPMMSRGRRMQGWVHATSEAFGDDVLREKLPDAALGFVRCLPAK